MELFCELSRAKGIKLLILSNPKLGYKSRISEDREILDSIENFNAIENSNRGFKDARDYRNKHDVSKQIKTSLENEGYSKSRLIKTMFEFIFFSANNHEKTHYTYFGRTK